MSKAPLTEIVADVTLVSRHGIAREVLRMRRAVEGMPAHLRSEIKEFFADSKSGIYRDCQELCA